MSNLYSYILIVLVLANVQTIWGGWEPIREITAPHVVSIAQYAIAQYNQGHGGSPPLKLVEISKGSILVGDQTKYRLFFSAKPDNADARNFFTEVQETPSVNTFFPIQT
ncbi:hypothetical protein RND81_06G143100 [Saponaria officinalis]|uniref:Cystatin domain-containing protein n=1 Tax=Saponaria officinalis TaxID=3572 RepID=A0AAW1KB80_SAPOF